MKPSEAVGRLHAAVDQMVAPLEERHRTRLQCRRGCHDCCRDGLTVFEVEADRIRERHPALLRSGVPHPVGRCAFLDSSGACRIYDVRPYVCRTQGLPLRWVDEEEGTPVEYRDICPLNDTGADLADLAPQDCWTLGAVEERLALIQLHRPGASDRVALRALFKSE